MENFIGAWIIDDISVCDDLIKYHKNSNLKTIGRTSNGVVPTVKMSVDVPVSINSDNQVVDRYLKELEKVCNNYIERYKLCDDYSSWRIVEDFNIQHYKPNEAYFGWHTERTSGSEPYSKRHLAFMTYLNDVDDKGETEFYYQKLKVKPKKGLTLIWPVDWTHTHRGVTSKTQDKYIITGWYSFI